MPNQTQFNYQLPSGRIVPASVNPEKAATINIAAELNPVTSKTNGLWDINKLTPLEKGGSVPLSLLQETVSQLNKGAVSSYAPEGAVRSRSGTPDPTLSGVAPIAPTVPPQGFQDSFSKPNLPYQTATAAVSEAERLLGLARRQSEADVQAGKPLSFEPGTATVATPSPLSGAPAPQPPTDLRSSTEMQTLKKDIKELREKIIAGVPTGRKALLETLLKEQGVTEERTIVQDLNRQILERTQLLRKLPKNLQENLNKIGVSQSQYERLLLQEAKPHEEILRDLLEKRGVAQERINDAMKFVGLFFDAEMKDKAAQLEANKFALESLEGDYKDLKADQRFIFGKILDQQKKSLTFAHELAKAGAIPEVVQDAANLSPHAALVKYGPILATNEYAKGIASATGSMTADEATAYVKSVAEATGRDPVVLWGKVQEYATKGKSNFERAFYLEHKRWPTVQEIAAKATGSAISPVIIGPANAQGRFDSALSGLSTAEAATVKLLVDYKMPLPSGFALKSPYFQRLLGAAAQYDPTFDATQYNVRLKLKQDFTSGKAATNIRSLNTVVGHLGSLNDTVNALDNAPIRLWNRIANYGLTQTGDPRVTNFEKAANAVVTELSTLFKGTGGTDQEIKAWRDTINSSQSPEQLKGGIQELIKLIASRMDALSTQYETGMGKPKDFHLLNNKAIRIFTKMGVDVNALDPISTGIKNQSQNAPKLLQPSEIPPGYYQASDGLLYEK